MENIENFQQAVDYVSANSNLTSTQSAAALGGTFGVLAGMATTMFIVAIVFYILLVIAQWRMFTKAGEKGWKSIIPIYNAYIYMKIIGLSFWKWFAALFVSELLLQIGVNANLGFFSAIGGIAAFVLTIVLAVLTARNTAKAFGKGTGFAVGLFFLPNIFQLIIGFGASEYKGVPSKE